VHGASTAHLALERGQRPSTVRAHRLRAERRLAQITRSAGGFPGAAA
jgi:hypothetical protein